MLRVIALFAFLALSAHAACPAGKVGTNCELDDPCAAGKNPCTNGQVCTGLDAAFKPVCACPLGMKGPKCADRDCPIATYTGKGFNNTLYLDNAGLEKADELNKLALACKVLVNVTASFTRSTHVADEVADEDFHLFVGQGMNFELLDSNGKLICDKKCLATPSLWLEPVQCFLKQLGDKHSTANPGVLRKKAFSAKADADLLKSRQVGCELRTDLPQAPPSLLVGAWRLVDSENWLEFLDANNIGFWTKMIVKNLKPDCYIENPAHKNWTISLKSTFKNLRSEFTEGVKWESSSPIAGDRTEHIAFSEGKNKIIEDQVIYSNPIRKVHIVREVINDKLVQTMTLRDVVCKRIYARIL